LDKDLLRKLYPNPCPSNNFSKVLSLKKWVMPDNIGQNRIKTGHCTRIIRVQNIDNEWIDLVAPGWL